MKLKQTFFLACFLLLGQILPAQDFAMVGDFGVSTGGQEVNAQAVADLIDSWNTEFILTVGDNNYDFGEASTIDANIGQYYSNYIHPYHPVDPSTNHPNNGGPNRFFPSPGNHDLDNPIGWDGQPYFEYFSGLYPLIAPQDVQGYYDFVKGDVHFFALNSDGREDDGINQTSTQALWLQNGLANSTSAWNIVYWHHPAFSSDGSSATRKWPFKDWGASAVFAGHVHTYERLDDNCFPHFVNGTGGRWLFGGGTPIPESEFQYSAGYGAQRMSADANNITFQFINVDNELIDSYSLGKCADPNTLTYAVDDIDPCAGVLDLDFANCENGYRLITAVAKNKWNQTTDLRYQGYGNTTTIDFEGLWFTRTITLTFSNCDGPDIVEVIDIPVCDDCCPEGSEFNGAHCSYLLYPPVGYNPFIWNNGFYTQYGPGGPGDCPPGTTDDGANCSYGINYPNGYNSFIWHNNFYVHQDCDIQIENCCPPGSKWDGANCYYGIHIPHGYTGFIGNDNGLYVHPNNGICPPGTTPTQAGCYYGVNITAGLTGFIWNNAFYANEDCGLEDCCPPDSYWNGEICKSKHAWPGYSGYIHPNGKIYLYPDMNGGCPPGTILNTNTNRCVTGVSVPLGYESEFVNGELNVFPDCENCCPKGWTFDGVACCKTFKFKDGQITIINGKPTIAEDCKEYPETCCPEGFRPGKYGCELRNSTDTETITYFDYTVTICKETESCLEDEKRLIIEDISQEYRFEEVTIAEENTLIKVFPNPFTTNLNIEVDNSSNELTNIEINSMTGQKMYSYTVREKGMLTFNLQPELNAGIYVLVLNFKTHQEFVKIIKL